jgi:hypothetical protein
MVAVLLLNCHRVKFNYNKWEMLDDQKSRWVYSRKEDVENLHEQFSPHKRTNVSLSTPKHIQLTSHIIKEWSEGVENVRVSAAKKSSRLFLFIENGSQCIRVSWWKMCCFYWHNSLPPIYQEFRLIQNILNNALRRSACWSICQVSIPFQIVIAVPFSFNFISVI